MLGGVGITTGWGETEVFMEVSSRRLAIVQHRHPPARGLLSLISLLSAFLLTGIKRNQEEEKEPPDSCPEVKGVWGVVEKGHNGDGHAGWTCAGCGNFFNEPNATKAAALKKLPLSRGTPSH